MAVRYRNTFKSLANVNWQIDIYDSEYTGSVNLFTTDKFGFELSYKGATERIDPILASSVTVPITVTDTTIESFLTETMAAQEERFTVKIYKNSALYWVGILLSDLITKEDIGFPYSYELTFTDGLARLKDIEYNTITYPSQYEIIKTPYTGMDTIISHLLKILSKTGTFSCWEDTDNFIKTIVNWYEIHHPYSIFCPLAYTRINHTIFYNHDPEPTVNQYNGTLEYTITFMNCYDVLEMILRTFNARIMMAGGIWVIVQPQEYSRITTLQRTFRRTGSMISCTTGENRITPALGNRKNGGLHKYIAPLLSVSKNYVPKQSCYEDGRLLRHAANGVVNPLLEYVIKDEVLDFSGYINEFCNETPSAFYSTYYIHFVLTDLTTGTHYYLGLGAGGYYWSASSTSVFFQTQLCPETMDPYEAYTLIEFSTPPFPANCSGTFEFNYYNSYYENGTVYGFYPGQTFNSFLAGESLLPTLFLNDAEKVAFIETNMLTSTTPVASRFKLELPDTLICDEPEKFNIGRLEVSPDYGTTWVPSALWGVHNSTNRLTINQLSVKQNLAGQRVPTKKYQGAFIDISITAAHSIRWQAQEAEFVPLSLKIYPDVDEVSGEWVNVLIPPL